MNPVNLLDTVELTVRCSSSVMIVGIPLLSYKPLLTSRSKIANAASIKYAGRIYLQLRQL